MKKVFLTSLLILLPYTTFCQVVKGQIIDVETGEAVPFATIYFTGTFMGTSSNEEGIFQIDATHFASSPLTISAIGYYSHTLRDFSTGRPLLIRLVPKVYEIGEVQVSGKDAARRRKASLKTFRKEFLGQSSNARKCKILNEEAISFIYDSDTDTLQAFAMEPLQVHNKALAYRVTYYLDQFVFHEASSRLYYRGNILFTQDDSTYRRFTRNRRKNAYLGSRMHFFRALWAGDLQSTKFTLGSSEESLSCNDIVFITPPETKFLTHSGSLVVHFADKWSQVNFKQEYVYFARDGFFDPFALTWEGDLGRKRVGDSLPYEYTPPLK